MLYELLTGTTPFDTRSLMEAGFAEMMRILREDEPHKPSTRLSSLGETGTRAAQQRALDLMPEHADPEMAERLAEYQAALVGGVATPPDDGG